MPRIFNKASIAKHKTSVFNLSYERKLTCDMGKLIPIMCDEVVPGDHWKIGNQIVIRFNPLVAPILHEINAYVHYFFVPYRLLWSDWEKFITGGADGQQTATLPTWNPSAGKNNESTLWDYLGFPTGVVPTDRLPLDFPRRAYKFIYQEYYRDETLIPTVDWTVVSGHEDIEYRAWEKDYFTSALPWQQRGIAPALPISGNLPLVFTAAVSGSAADAANSRVQMNADKLYMPGGTTNANLLNALNSGVANAAGATTFNVSDLRLAFQIQRWLERNARAGARYKEFLLGHFNVAPRDERLQRPEYIGGSKSPVLVSEVLKTSSTDGTSPQGNMAGHAITVDREFCGKYYAQEYGLIMGILSVMPRSAYQQGIDRQWLRQTKYDFYFPEFANLSEQAIERVELYASNVAAENKTIFGYQGKYDELRCKRTMVSGAFRSTFNYWHMGRIFGAAPLLNQEFVECRVALDKRQFAVQNVDELLINFGNVLKVVRPLPFMPEPGLIDH